MFRPATLFVRTLELICTYLAVWGCNRQFPPPVTSPIDFRNLPSFCHNQNISSCLVVNTTSGLVQGYWANSFRGQLYRAFEGVPYAAPPMGRLRFREPRPLRPTAAAWTHVMSANRHVTCMQMSPLNFYKVVGQEDCLVLNIYAAWHTNTTLGADDGSQDALLPVYVFIHGGGFYWGSAHSNGPTYLMDSHIILVTINYRLGVLGFLSTPADVGLGGNGAPGGIYGNWGLKDQALALEWIRDNIRSFGGDPARVTIGGQSAGGVSAHLHMLSPLSRGLFAGVIAQSGSALSHWALPRGQDKLRVRLAKSVGCQDDEVVNMVDCLREVPGHVLVEAQFELFDWYWFHNPPILFGPTVETNYSGAFLPAQPMEAYEKGLVAKVPLVTGVVKDEGQLFPLAMPRIPFGVHLLLGRSYETFPNLLMYDARNKSLTDAIRSHYFRKWASGPGDVMSLSPGGTETYTALGEMVRDRNYYTGLHKTLEYHSGSSASNLGHGPVYAYVFSYKGRHGIPELLGAESQNWGVMHGDELQYLFNSTEFFAPLESSSPGDPDVVMSERLIQLWTNFIKTGQSSTEWMPFTSKDRRVLEINGETQMRMQKGDEILHVDGVKFWKSIGLY